MDELLVVGRVLVSLAVVAGLIWYLARRFGGAGRTPADDREPHVRVVDRQALGRSAGVAVVAVGSRRLLVGFGEQQVTMLTELGPVHEQPAPAVPAPRPAPRADALPGAQLPTGGLAGSVLSPATWRATVRALQDRTVRR
ncbi:flagellar protein [Cellulomonas sp. JZ18]|uniref:FliO/MopB family protein n=1 Tax=Cellulomonas sp. JZ18 TaxID=2654191 RepID=UPI0012D3835B|nr:flagellar biosynthetic protein FliO [Cellulomonas sp. JZ18]QGQ20294.1 flagellar protein [Cellulomonas sp. JZ18]